MDLTCPNCGAANRTTSRFCARCGEALLPAPADTTEAAGSTAPATPSPPSTPDTSGATATPSAGMPEPEQGEGLNLPWLQGVHERAVRQTGNLSQERAAEIEARRAGGQTSGAAPTPGAAPAGRPQESKEAQQPAPTPAQPQQPAVPVPTQGADGQGQPGTGSSTEEGPPPDEPPPSWVVGILEPNSPSAASQGAGMTAQQDYEPEELDHIMPWLNHAPGAPNPEGSTPGLPPWLGGMTVQETLDTTGPESAAPDVEIEGLQPFAPPEVAKPKEQEKEPEQELEPFVPPTPISQPSRDRVPEWLKSFSPGTGQEEVSPITSRSPVTRVVLSPTDTLAEPIKRDVQVRPPRPGSVETLAALLQTNETAGVLAEAPVGAAGRQRGAAEVAARPNPLLTWLLPDGVIYLVILAALLAVLLIRPAFGDVDPPAAPGALEFYSAVEAAPDGKPVLVAFDWDAGRSAEMTALSEVVTHHLMSRHKRFVTLSTIPQGPGFAQQITSAAASDQQANYGYAYGRDYLVLGYLPGNEAALRALANDFGKAMPLDYVSGQGTAGSQFMAGQKVASLDDFGLIIDLASDETALRNWVEQVSPRVPVIAAVPQALQPLALPYRGVKGAGLRALISGQAGALQYARQLSAHGLGTALPVSAAAVTNRLDALSVAQLLVALTIIGAFANFLAKDILRR